MSVAIQQLEHTLKYNAESHTLILSSFSEGLFHIREALQGAFGLDELKITNIIKRRNPELYLENEELLCFQGKTSVFGYNREIYLEFGLRDGIINTFLTIINLPNTWNLSAGFNTKKTPNLNHPLHQPLMVISAHLPAIKGDRTFIEYDENAAVEQGTETIKETMELTGHPFLDGLQIITQGGIGQDYAFTAALQQHGIKATLSPAMMPNPDDIPDRMEVRVHQAEGWLKMERWWDSTAPPEGLHTEGIHANGVGELYWLNKPGTKPAVSFLQEIGTFEAPIVMEAILMESPVDGADFYPIRFISRIGRDIPLGDGLEVLESLVSRKGFDQLQTYELPAINALKLRSLTYAPGDFVQLTVVVGDYRHRNEHLVEFGPVGLSEAGLNLFYPLSDESPLSVSFEGVADFFGTQFKVKFKPWTLIEGGLYDAEGVDLGGFLKRVLPVSLPFGLDTIKLSSAWVRRYLSGKKSDTAATTDFSVRLTGEVDLVPKAIQLTNIELDISHPSTGANTVSFGARLRLGPLALQVAANNEAGAWAFSGRLNALNDEGGISLKDLVNHLVDSFGATVPDAIPDVRLETLALLYKSDVRFLQIEAITNFKVEPEDIPVIGGTEQRVILQLSMIRNPQEGGSEFALSLEWVIQKGDKSGKAKVQLSKASQLFSFDLMVEDEKKPAKLSDLTDELGLPFQIPQPISGGLDMIFQASYFSLSYDRVNSHFATSWTRPLGEGLLLMEYDQRNDQSQDHQKRIEVSWMGYEPKSTIGIVNLLDTIGAKDEFETFKSIMGTFGLHDVVEGVEHMLTFRQLGFNWQKDRDQSAITVTAFSTFPYGKDDDPVRADGVTKGTKAFLAYQGGKISGFVAGISLFEEPDPTKEEWEIVPMLPDFLPTAVHDFLAVASGLLSSIHITHLIVSTLESHSYQPPAFSIGSMQPAYMQQQASSVSRPFGIGSMMLTKGLALGVQVDIANNEILSKIIPFDRLEGQLMIGKEVGIYLSIPESVKLEAGGGNYLALSDPYIMMKAGGASLSMDLGGSLEIQLLGQRLALQGWLSLSPQSILGHLKLTELPGGAGIRALPGVFFEVSEESPFYLEVGIQFAPLGINLGLQGDFYICSSDPNHPYKGSVTFVLQIIELVPHPLYIEFSIDRLNLFTLLEALTGTTYTLREAQKLLAVAEEAGGDIAQKAREVSENIDEIEDMMEHIESVLSAVQFEDVYFRWADSFVHLPDGTTAMPGISFKGKLKVFDWDAFAMLDFSLQDLPGISGHMETELINLQDIVILNGGGIGIQSAPQNAEDFYADQGENVPTDAWYLQPGGPVFHMSTRAAPFFYADLHADIFGALHADIHAEISAEGFEFDFRLDAGGSITAHWNCHWWKNEGVFEASGDMGVHLHGDLGPIIPGVDATAFHIDTDLDAYIRMRVSATEFLFEVNGHFEFEGASLPIPEITVEVAFSKIEDIADIIWDKIEDSAEDIFEEFLFPIGELIGEAAEEVAEVATAAAEEVAEFASDAADEIGDAAGAAADKIGDAAGVAADAADAAVSELTDAASAISGAAVGEAVALAGPILEDASKVGEEAIEVAEEAIETVKNLGKEAAKAFSAAEDFVEDLAADVAHEVAQKLDDARRWVSNTLDDAAAAAAHVLAEAEEIINGIENAIEDIAKEIGHYVDLLEDLAKAAWNKAKKVGGAIVSVGKKLLPF